MQTDYVQPFLFEDLDIRGRLVCLSGAWARMVEGRDYPAPIAEVLGQTTALAVLLGANQKGSGRVTLQVRGNGPVSLLVADCTSDLRIRGMAHFAPGATGGVLELLGDGRFALTLDDGRSEQLYQSIVPLQGDTLSDTFSSYLARSEQVEAFLLLLADDDAACGLVLEKLPRADERDPDGWNRMTRFAATLTLRETLDTQPYDLLTRLFPEELLRVYKLARVEYHCPYDVEKVKDMLRSLGRAEVESILAEKGEVLIRNEMCNHEYRFDSDAVAQMFAEEN
ncbi:MAG: Hsp33 family molecular chaperone HslO [Proteobacteria bacterium]|nr:Hsp33 family molecular chaperone HslO [Pseudomonadota bacterium]